MFSKKTRNLTVAVLALVMALTLSFGLFGFNSMEKVGAEDSINPVSGVHNFNAMTGSYSSRTDNTIGDFRYLTRDSSSISNKTNVTDKSAGLQFKRSLLLFHIESKSNITFIVSSTSTGRNMYFAKLNDGSARFNTLTWSDAENGVANITNINCSSFTTLSGTSATNTSSQIALANGVYTVSYDNVEAGYYIVHTNKSNSSWYMAQLTITSVAPKYDATWAWSGDNATLTLTLGDGSKTTPKCENKTNVVTPATCTTAGAGKLSATATYEGATYEMPENLQKDVVIPALGHNYDVEPTWAIEGTTATATFACKNGCGEKVTQTAETITEADPTETELGFKGTGATVTYNDKVYSYASEVTGLVYHADVAGNYYATKFVGTAAQQAIAVPSGWDLNTKKGATDTINYKGLAVYPESTGNSGSENYWTYTLPAATKNYRKITKVVVYAGALSSSNTTMVNVAYKDANDKFVYGKAQKVASAQGEGNSAGAYSFEINQVGTTQIRILNDINGGNGTAKLAVMEVVVYYEEYDNAVTVVDGETQTTAYANANYTLPAQAGLTDYTPLGWTDGTNLYKAGDTVEVAEGTTVTALYAKLGFVGGSVRTTDKLGVRYMFELEVYNATKEVTDLVASTITGKFNLQTSQANEIAVAGYKVEGNKIAMNAVVINNFDSVNNTADKALCTNPIVASININVAGQNMSLTADGLSIAYIAEVALGKNEISLAQAQKYGYVQA